MKSKHILFSLTMLVISANAGFFNHDKAYYASHIEDAEKKIKSCKREMAIARIDKDKAKAKALKKDQECKDAFDAVKEHKREIRKAKYKVEQEEREKIEAKQKALFNKEYQAQLVELEKMPYPEFYTLKDSCGFIGLGKTSAKCKAYQVLKNKREKLEIKVLISQYQGDDLIIYRKKTCKEQGHQNANCELAMSATAKDEQDTIKLLSSDKEALKKVFNECQVKIKAYQQKMKWDDVNTLTQSFKCRTAMVAARTFNIFGFSSSMK